MAKPVSLTELSAQARVIAPVVGAFTVSAKLVVLVIPAPVADTIIVDGPPVVELVVLIVNVEEQVVLQLAGEKEAVAPAGNPAAEKVTA
jgi:hypothetical protein